MGNYVEIKFENISTEQAEMLIAKLGDAGFEGFEENTGELKAFVPEEDLDEKLISDIAQQVNVTFQKQLIRETNWNEVWESNFPPVIVNDFVAVRAEFHEPIPGVEHEIVITPKMSFGTGHHATTFMMMQQMRDIDFRNKTVFDFGTGTGVLAILAEKLGAQSVKAIDIDEWSINNAIENCNRNKCEVIEILQLDTADVKGNFDIILANINKNVIVDNFQVIVSKLARGGVILFSGLLKEDEEDIIAIGQQYLLVFAGTVVKDNWLCLKFLSNQ